MRYVADRPDLGQSAESGFDCSGFVRQVLQGAGLCVPNYIGMDGVRRPIRHASEFWDHYGVNVGTNPQGGDLIFFSRKGTMPTHIGVVRDEETYIHAPGYNDTRVEVATIKREPIVGKMAVGRVLYATNPIGFKAPTIPYNKPTYRYHQQLAE